MQNGSKERRLAPTGFYPSANQGEFVSFKTGAVIGRNRLGRFEFRERRAPFMADVPYRPLIGRQRICYGI